MPADLARRALARALALHLLVLGTGAAGCGGVLDDLAPSGKDERPPVVAGSIGPAVGQTAPDFRLQDTDGVPVSLYQVLSTSRGAVLYFTMWCSICFEHMGALRADMAANPDVTFLVIDYVTGSVAGARQSQQLYASEVAGFRVLADADAEWVNFYRSPMGTVIVDRNRVVRWNSDYFPQRVPDLIASLP